MAGPDNTRVYAQLDERRYARASSSAIASHTQPSTSTAGPSSIGAHGGHVALVLGPLRPLRLGGRAVCRGSGAPARACRPDHGDPLRPARAGLAPRRRRGGRRRCGGRLTVSIGAFGLVAESRRPAARPRRGTETPLAHMAVVPGRLTGVKRRAPPRTPGLRRSARSPGRSAQDSATRKEQAAQLPGCADFPCRCCDLAQTVVHIS
jgi:hypothetical protein